MVLSPMCRRLETRSCHEGTPRRGIQIVREAVRDPVADGPHLARRKVSVHPDADRR